MSLQEEMNTVGKTYAVPPKEYARQVRNICWLENLYAGLVLAVCFLVFSQVVAVAMKVEISHVIFLAIWVVILALVCVDRFIKRLQAGLLVGKQKI